MTRRSRLSRRAFTLIEAVATITVLAALGTVSSTIIYTAMDAYTDASIAAQIQAEASLAMDRLTREIEKIPLDNTLAFTAPKISSVTATSMAWNTNYSMSFSGGKLNYVDAGAASAVLLDNVTAFTLQTYDESNAALAATLAGAACNPIRRVQLAITVTSHGVSATIRTKRFIRSTMEGGDV